MWLPTLVEPQLDIATAATAGSNKVTRSITKPTTATTAEVAMGIRT